MKSTIKNVIKLSTLWFHLQPQSSQKITPIIVKQFEDKQLVTMVALPLQATTEQKKTNQKGEESLSGEQSCTQVQ